jgi:MFS family permease
VLAFTGYLLARSAEAFILLRGLAGALTAGLIPAVMGIVADIAPADRRAQEIGIVNGGGAAGWIIGPVIGGALYDRWGHEIPFILSIVLAFLTLVFALLAVPETNPGSPGPRPQPASPEKRLARASWLSLARSVLGSIPRPLGIFMMLLGISFVAMFAWAFVEPQLMFYVYDDLGWTSRQLGLAISAYGVAMMLGEFTLGRLSDRLGRKPVLLLGLVLFSAQFAGLVLSRDYAWLAACFVVAGLGNALYDPPLNALFLDLAPQAHKGRVMGLKSTAGSLGSMIGPALVVLLSARLLPGNFFLISLILVLISAFLSLLALQVPGKPQAAPGFEEGKTPGAGIRI